MSGWRGKGEGRYPERGTAKLYCRYLFRICFLSFFSFCVGVLLPLRIAHSAPWRSEDWDFTSFFVFVFALAHIP